ncbi:MAG: cyclic nucleotide-binding domain-containing protein [Alphaproteobacteria bacterium]|nr:cyclic nucleotide-binding domain-containing protein [Alphaproteobacteria bacterium]
MSDDELGYTTFAAGQIIFRRGDPPTYAYLVTTGGVEHGGSEQVIDSAGPGDVFGEMSLVENLPRSATARATEDTVCATFSIGDVRKRLSEADVFTVGLLRLLIKRLRRATDRKADS